MNAPDTIPGDDPFELARKGQTEGLAQWFGDGGNVHITNERGDGLLLLACYYGRLDTVDMLLAQGAEVDARNKSGQRPLTGACFKGFDAVAKRLIEAGADIEESVADMKTPLMYAASYEHATVIKLLLKAGADRDARVGDKTAADYARDNLAHSVIPLLENRLAD